MESGRGRPAVGALAGQFADEQDAGQLAVGVRGELPVGAPGAVQVAEVDAPGDVDHAAGHQDPGPRGRRQPGPQQPGEQEAG